MQALARQHAHQRPAGDLQVLDKVEAVHLCPACRHLGQIPALGRRRTTHASMRIGRPMALQNTVDRGSRYARTVLLQRALDGIRPILAQHALLAQMGSRLQNVPLHGSFSTIPSATGLMIGKRDPIQPLASTAVYPERHGAHINPELSRHRSQRVPGSHSPNHLTTLAFNGAFFAMINPPQNPLPYRRCWTNAEPQVLDER